MASALDIGSEKLRPRDGGLNAWPVKRHGDRFVDRTIVRFRIPGAPSTLGNRAAVVNCGAARNRRTPSAPVPQAESRRRRTD